MDYLTPSYYFDLSAYRHADLFTNIKYVWESLPKLTAYLQTCSLGNIEGKVDDKAHLVHSHKISIGEGSIVEPGAYIKGPCIIGKNCTIRHGAYIRGDVIIGDNCIIGHDTEVKHSILLNGAKAPHFAYVGDSILGNNVNLGAGVKCANFKLKGDLIVIYHSGEKQETGLRKLGAILGDGCQIGCNSVTNPGTLAGKEVICHPCMNFGGFIPSFAVIKKSAESVQMELR